MTKSKKQQDIENTEKEYEKYFLLQQKYEKKYGTKTVVLMEMGSFMEIYGLDFEDEKIGHIEEITEILNISCTKKNGKLPHSKNNPLMAGVNTSAVSKYIKILLEHNYTVVIVNQFDDLENSKKNAKMIRKVTKIYSPGTYVESDDLNTINDRYENNIISIYVDENKSINSNNMLKSIGLARIDLTTGDSSFYEVYDNDFDTNYAYDETYRFIQSFDGKEIIINLDDNSENSNRIYDDLLDYLELNQTNKIVHKIDLSDKTKKKIKKISFQNKFFKEYFNIKSQLQPIEYLGLERSPYTIISLISLLQYAYEHDSSLLTKISIPKSWQEINHLTLSYNAINQLNLYSSNKNLTVFDVINNTNTSMGHRLLKYSLLNPILEKHDLHKKYDEIEFMKNYCTKKKDFIKPYLKKIIDIDRYFRKLCLGKLHPKQFTNLHSTFLYIVELLDQMIKNYPKEYDDDFEIIMNKKNLKKIKKKCLKCIKYYKEIFILENLKNYRIDNIDGQLFQLGQNKEIDNIIESVKTGQTSINSIHERYNNIVKENSKPNHYTKKDDFTKYVRLEKNIRDGYYFLITKNRYKILEEKLSNSELDGLIIKSQSNNYKITSDKMKYWSIEIDKDKCVLIKLNKDFYIKKIQKIASKFEKYIKDISYFIAKLDLTYSNAKTAILNNYNRPIIVDSDNSNIKAKKLRHPLVEKINKEIPYVPNDVELGTKNSLGMILMGVNASGKTVFAKAIGIAIVMAQAGMFVPAKSMEYTPFKNILTRILGNDNILKSLSSFAVEMTELKSILTRANKNSLILGDEICRGTEQESGTALVAASIIKLQQSNAPFIYTTHLHALRNIPEIDELKNVNFYHLTVEKENIEGTTKLIYDRKLKKGAGPNTYGILVAEALGLNRDFIKLAEKLRRERITPKELQDNNILLNPKKSKYNSNVFLGRCAVCNNRAEDIHHIKFQCTADENDIIDTFDKDVEHNLVALCKKCHQNVHSKKSKLKINGWIQTSSGRELDFVNS